MHENPEPTDEEYEQAPERIPEEDAKSAPGHEDPARSRPEPTERPPVEPEDRG